MFAPVYGFNDEAPLALRRWHKPFECDDALDGGYHLLFLPMSLRGELLGFLCCAAKTDRTAFISDEIAALALLSDRTGIASVLLAPPTGSTLAV
jgi:GAF domain-containing protein